MSSSFSTDTQRSAEGYISDLDQAEGLCFTCAYPCEAGGKNYHLHSKQFRNHLRELERRKEGRPEEADALDRLIARGEELARDKERWSGDYQGVCIHISRDHCELLRLHESPQEVIHLGSGFLFRPAADALGARMSMLALHLSFKSPRLFSFSGDKAKRYTEVDLPESVYSFSDDGVLEPGRHAHVRQSSDNASKEIVNQGFSAEESPRDLNEPIFLREIARSLCELEESRKLPLVVIGDESLVASFRQTYEHPHGDLFFVTDADSHPDEAEVARVCSEIARKIQADAKQAALESVKSSDPTSELFCDNLREAYEAATQARIRTCVVSAGESAWSTYDEYSGLSAAYPEEKKEAFDAYDRVYAETIMKGGEAIVVPADQVPGAKKVAALLRW